MSPTRTRISNADLPGWTSEMSPGEGSVITRREVFDPSGTYVGTVVYARRRRRTGSEYGWRPERQPRAALTSQLDAIRRLDRFPS